MNIFSKNNLRYEMIPEYRSFVDAYRKYRQALHALRAVQSDIRKLNGEYDKLKAEQNRRFAKKEVPIDPMFFKNEVDNFHSRLSELRIREREAEERFFAEEKTFRAEYRKFATVYDSKIIRPMIVQYGSLMNNLRQIETDLEDVFRELNSKGVIMEDSELPKVEFGQKVNQTLDLAGYSAWREKIKSE
jgi:hypothetical protein